jgi:hypothetical protein
MTASAVVINFNTKALLLRCVESLAGARERGEIDEIIVVDCDSTDGSAEAVEAAWPLIQLIRVSNRGYGAGANAGMAAANGDSFLILNADTEVTPGAVARLAETLAKYPAVAVVGPRLVRPNGETQPSRRRFPTPLTPIFESTLIEERWPANRWAHRYHMDESPDDAVQSVDWVVGAAMLVRRRAVEQAGGFDERFWMFCEETEWCHRFRRHGWRTLYDPSAAVLHHEGASTGQDIPRRQREFDSSRVELQRLLFGDFVAETVRAALMIGYAVMLVREGGKWLAGHRRPLRAARLRSYWQALRSGLRRQEPPTVSP